MHPLQSRRFLILAPASSSLLLRKAGAFFSDRSNSKISGPGIYSAVCLIVILPPPQFCENFHPRTMHALLVGLGAVMAGKEMLKGPALFSLDFSTSQTR
jgi:hypothetical protein